MGFKLLWKGEHVDVQERAAGAGVRKQIFRLNEQNVKTVSALLNEHPELATWNQLSEDEQKQRVLENPALKDSLLAHNLRVEVENVDYVLRYIRIIVNRDAITDPDLRAAVEQDIDSSFWDEQDPEELEPVVDRFREAYKL